MYLEAIFQLKQAFDVSSERVFKLVSSDEKVSSDLNHQQVRLHSNHLNQKKSVKMIFGKAFITMFTILALVRKFASYFTCYH